MNSESSIKDILTELGFSTISDNGKNYRCRPAYRSSSSSSVCSVQKETGLWYDFKENIGGNLQDLVCLCLNIGRDEAEKYLLSKNYQPKAETEECEPISTVKKYPREWLAKLEKSSAYWESRNVTKRTLEAFEGGVATSGRMYHRYVFPIFDEKDNIVGFAGRDLLKNSPESRPKWKLLGAKNLFSYPYHLSKPYIEEKQSVILVESIGDMLSLWDAGVRNVLVTFGLNLGAGVIKTLLKTRPKKIVIALNNDLFGNSAGNRAAIEFKNELMAYFDESTIEIKFPEKKDFGEMTVEEIHIWQK